MPASAPAILVEWRGKPIWVVLGACGVLGEQLKIEATTFGETAMVAQAEKLLTHVYTELNRRLRSDRRADSAAIQVFVDQTAEHFTENDVWDGQNQAASMRLCQNVASASARLP